MNTVGIEAINLYGTSMYMEQKDLAIARKKDPDTVVHDFLIEKRSINPLWEDAVTMGVNAATPLFADGSIKREDIGLLIVGTESSVDFGKPISTNIHKALGLGKHVRNYETKFACYSGMAANDAAINWVASGLNKGKKALVIATDFSREHLNTKQEFVMGGLAGACIISDTPKIVEFETTKKGVWTSDIYDTFRPSAHDEVGNNEVSLFSYTDALEYSYTHYVQETIEAVDFRTYFDHFVFHTPMPAMARHAHRIVAKRFGKFKKSELEDDFSKRVLPAITIAKHVGSCYGISNYAGLISTLLHSPTIKPGNRIGCFTYGSGAIGEFYSVIVCKDAQKHLEKFTIMKNLEKRRRCSVEEYEFIELVRKNTIEKPEVRFDFTMHNNWFDTYYKGSNLLILKEVREFIRYYERV